MDKNAATSEITVNHEEIPGFMPAMTMPYKVKDPAVVEEVEPGDKIAAGIFLQSSVLQDLLLRNLSLFAQDTWQATHRLTLTYGKGN